MIPLSNLTPLSLVSQCQQQQQEEQVQLLQLQQGLNQLAKPITYMYSLPNEVIESIMKYLSAKDICIYLSTLSHYFYKMSRSNSLWHYFCIKDFKICKNINKLLINTVDWFNEYILMHRSLVDICFRPLYLSDELNYVKTRKVKINNFNIHYDDKLDNINQNTTHITILNSRKTKPDSTLFVQSKRKVTPLPYGNFNIGYFEITLLSIGEDNNVFIGYSASCETNEKKIVLKSAVSYHGGDGGMYPNPVMGKEISEPWQCNDTAGCGVDFINKKIFFTKNGVLLGKTTSSLSISKLHATIGTLSFGDKFTINFGTRPFEFDIIQYQKESMLPVKYPLYSIALSMHDRFLCEYFEDNYSMYVDDEMNKITTPVNKEIAYLSDFKEYPNTDRIMKNKIHKYCHQIGQQVNGGFTISPDDQNNMTELRRGLEWYWIATRQHYLLLHFVRASIDVDLKYSPAIELTPVPTDDIAMLDEIAKRRMAKEISVLLSNHLDSQHPIVISVIRHTQSTIQRFEQTMNPEYRSIYRDFEQMLQAAEHTDMRMFFALSLSVIIQTREISKNNKLKKEKRAAYLKRERDIKRQEIEYLIEKGVNIDNLLEFNRDQQQQQQQNNQNQQQSHPILNNNPLTSTSINENQDNSSNNNVYLNLELEEQQRLFYLDRILCVLKQEIRILSSYTKRQEPLSEAAIDIIVWTSLRLSFNIKNNQDPYSYRDIVIKSLKEEEIKMEAEIKKLSINSHRRTSSNSNSNNSSLFSQSISNTTLPNGKQIQSQQPILHEHIIHINNDGLNDSDASSSSSSALSSSTNSPNIRMVDLSVDVNGEDVMSPLCRRNKRHPIIRRPFIISASVVLFSVVLIIIIIVSLKLS